MIFSRPRPGAACRFFAVAALGCTLGLSTHASPEANTADPMAQLLQDRGVVPALPAEPQPADAGFAQHMRHSASEMVVSAMNYLGVRYRRGGNNAEDGFDCSGFTRYLFANSLGLMLPRRADEQASAPGLQSVKRSELQPGDLVFFNTLKRTFSHVGVYIGEGKFIHAPRSGANVRIEDMRFSYWAKRFTGARRAESLPTAPTAHAGATAVSQAPSAAPQSPAAASTGGRLNQPGPDTYLSP